MKYYCLNNRISIADEVYKSNWIRDIFESHSHSKILDGVKSDLIAIFASVFQVSAVERPTYVRSAAGLRPFIERNKTIEIRRLRVANVLLGATSNSVQDELKHNEELWRDNSRKLTRRAKYFTTCVTYINIVAGTGPPSPAGFPPPELWLILVDSDISSAGDGGPYACCRRQVTC